MKAPQNAIAFLKAMYPEGPWCLTAISIDRTGVTTKTFRPENEGELNDFIQKHNNHRNLYFHVNPVKGNLTKKAKRENIASVDYLHVDVDPEPGQPLEEERARILELLTNKLPKGVPQPTVLTFSGGGYQAFWKLEEPIPINGDVGLAEDAKLYNMQLERVFGGDNCHNIDRLMRLPFTMNIPDEKKIKKGREPVLAQLIDWQADNVYDRAKFQKAVEIQMDGVGKTKADQEVTISGNVERLDSLDFLRDQYGVDDITLVAISQGRDENNPKEKDDSRSAWVFHVACQLARAEVPDDVIFSLLTDPDWGISESVLEMGANAEKYAIRQIARGKQHAIDPKLLMLNERYAVVMNFGGKCRVIEEVEDRGTGTTILTKMLPTDFQNAWCDQEVWIPNPRSKDGAPMPVKLGKWWFEHPKRRKYNRIVFEPTYTGTEDYNLWRGFAVSAIPGECGLFMDHIRDNLCGGKEEYFNYLIGWMARVVQKPDRQGEVAVVLRGGRGSGKSFFATHFGKLFGRHFKHVSNGQHLVGNFNAHLRDCLVLFADEAFFAGDKKHESVLKTIITESTIPIEPKGVDLEHVANYIHLIMASNNEHVIPAGPDERRFFVLEVADHKKQDKAYFAAIAKQLADGGYEALLDFLMKVDLEGFEVRNVPETDALKTQKLLSLSPFEEWWFVKLQDGRLLEHHNMWQQQVPFDELLNDFINSYNRMNSSRRGSQTAFGKFMNGFLGDAFTRSWIKPSKLPKGHTFAEYTDLDRAMNISGFPTLAKCREIWEDKFGPMDWPEPLLTEGEDQPEFQTDQEVPF